MTDVVLRMATREDAKEIAGNLREADLGEMKAVLGTVEDPAESLIYGVDNSAYPMVATIDGVPVSIFGVIRDPINADVGCVWMMGTDEMTRRKKLFLRHALKALETLFGSFRLLWCCMDKRNTVHVRWIQWLGFSLLREHPSFGEQRKPFLEFAKLNTNV